MRKSMARRCQLKRCLTWAPVLAYGLACGTLAYAQNNLDEVHITPPAAEHNEEPQAKLLADASIIRKNVDMVLVPVTVTDDRNRIITGLDQTNFQLFDGKQRQEIKHFSSEDAPVSLGIVLDVSHSMESKMEWAREAVLEFCRAANPLDEFFMVTFSNQPELASDFTSKVENIQKRLLFATASGRTALLDGVSLALNQMRKAQYQKRSLLIISDGGDNHSRYTESEIKAMVKEADVEIYSIGIFDRVSQIPEELAGPILLDEITKLTGGRAFTVENPNLLPAIALRVGTELRNQYVLAYSPEKTSQNGKWHKINIKLSIPKSLWPVWIHAKQGYYAPSR
jgi:Ca-activated chloride channel family protein